MRLPKLLLFVVALAIGAAACGDSGLGEVASIDGESVDIGDVTALRSSYETGEINTNNEQFRIDLTNVLFRETIVRAARDDLGITVTDAEIDERIVNPPPVYAAVFAQVRADPDLTEQAVRHQATISLLRDRIAIRLVQDDGDLATVLEESPELFSSACVRHVLVGTAAEADDVKARLDAGEDFAAVADEVSLDTAASGGELLSPEGSCMLPLANYVPEFGSAAATAALGEVFGPIETQFGFHVIVVDERMDPPSIDDIKADPIGVLSNSVVSDYFTPWFNEAVRASTIEIDPLIGSWSESGIGIVPPGG